MKTLALTAMLLWSNAVFAQPQTVTLLCKGKVTAYGNGNPQTITNMVLVVNFAEKTITGFDHIVANIYIMDAAYISFKTFLETSYAYGTMDRKTNFVAAATGELAIDRKWELTCTPTK
jgi:hypothetical protein